MLPHLRNGPKGKPQVDCSGDVKQAAMEAFAKLEFDDMWDEAYLTEVVHWLRSSKQ